MGVCVCVQMCACISAYFIAVCPDTCVEACMERGLTKKTNTGKTIALFLLSLDSLIFATVNAVTFDKSVADIACVDTCHELE